MVIQTVSVAAAGQFMRPPPSKDVPHPVKDAIEVFEKQIERKLGNVDSEMDREKEHILSTADKERPVNELTALQHQAYAKQARTKPTAEELATAERLLQQHNRQKSAQRRKPTWMRSF